MRVKMISRNPDQYLRETNVEDHKQFRNYNPKLHPLQHAREYVKALNATKLERVFAKPFVACLDGHTDSINCLSRHSSQLSTLLSGSYDGEIRVWDVTQRICRRNFVAHEGVVRGICYQPQGGCFFSIGDDKTIKTWSSQAPGIEEEEKPINTIINRHVLAGISHHRSAPMFATCGDVCQLWEESRNEPVHVYQWGVPSLHDVAFNLVETNVLSTCASDNSVILYDVRDVGPIRKVTLKMRGNRLSWNPMEGYTFTVANEDYRLYTFDTRNLVAPVNIHKDHVSAVMDVCHAPTGKEFVSVSWDRTIRIFETDKGHSRDVYHTKRMQKLSNVLWSMDNKYIFTASDEMNVRIWKSNASEKLGIVNRRETESLRNAEALKKKFKNYPEIRRIARHRQVPKHVLNAQHELRVIQNKAKAKEANVRKHSKKNMVPFVPERKKLVVRDES